MARTFANESWSGVQLWSGRQPWQWLAAYRYRKPCEHGRWQRRRTRIHSEWHVRTGARCWVLVHHHG